MELGSQFSIMVHKRKKRNQPKDGKDDRDVKPRQTSYEDLVKENGNFDRFYKVSFFVVAHDPDLTSSGSWPFLIFPCVSTGHGSLLSNRTESAEPFAPVLLSSSSHKFTFPCQAQKLVQSDEEWTQMIECLKSDLPAAFRITSGLPETNFLLKIVQGLRY